VETEGDTVLDVGLHALENLASGLDGKNDGGETWGEEDNIGGGLGSLRGTLDGNTTVRLLERWSIVDTVTSHGSQVTTLLEHLDDLVLVLWENLCETVGTLNEIVLHSAGKTTVDELGRVVNLGTESKHLASLLGDSDSVTSQHLDWDTKSLSLNNGLGSVVTWRVEHRKHTEENPWLVVLPVGDTEGTETTAGELGGLVAEESGLLLTGGGKVEDGLWSTLGAFVAVTTESADGDNTLGDRVERSEFLSLPVVLEDVACLGVALEGKDGDLVNWVEGLDVVGRGESGDGHHPVDVLALGDERLTDGKLVSGKSTGLVGTEDINTGKGLNGGKLLNDSLLLGEVSSTDGEGGGGDDWETDWNTDNKHDKSNGEKGLGGLLWSGNAHVAEETTDPGDENPEDDEDEKSRSDGVHDSLEVTLVLGALNKHGGATDEGVLSGGEADSVGLSTLATGSVVDDIAHELVNSEGFSGDGRLVGSDERVTLFGDTLLTLLTILLFSWLLLWVEQVLFAEFLVLGKVLWDIVVADNTGIDRDGLTFLDDDLEIVVLGGETVMSRGSGYSQCHLGRAHEREYQTPDHHG